VAKLTAAGAWEWAQAVGGTEAETASGLSLMTTGDVVLAGTFESSPATFGPTTLHAIRASAFVGRLQSSGTWRWVGKPTGAWPPLPQWQLTLRATPT
jgi:hypothetical protein